MTQANYDSAKVLQDQLNSINAVQAKLALAGITVKVIPVYDSGGEAVSENDLKAALGSSGYNSFISSTLTSLNTALSNAESTANTSFGAL